MNEAMASGTACSAAAPELRGLDFLWLEITTRCNLTCTHCYSNSDMQQPLRGKLTLDDWLSILRQAAELGCQKVQFIGGEPTVHPDLCAMIEAADRLHFQSIGVYTNATHFSPQLKQAFEAHKVALAISIYGTDPATHDLVTGHQGSFDRTVASLRWALQAGLKVRVGVTEMEENQGQLETIKKWLEAEGVKTIRWDRVRGIGRGIQQIRGVTPFNELCGACWRGRLCVCADGDVYPCVFARAFPVGNAQEGLAAIVGNDRLLTFRRDIKARGYEPSTMPAHDGVTSANSAVQ